MKKLVVMAIMMVAAVSANAQFEPGTFSIQPQLGGTISLLSNMPDITGRSSGGTKVTLDKTPIAGLIIGAEAEYQLASMLSLAAGVNYSMQGCGWADYEEKMGDTQLELKDAKIQLGYVNVPVVANIYLFKGFAIKAGVQFGFLTNANEQYSLKGSSKSSSGSSINVNSDYDESIKDYCEKMDISIPMGVSYQVPTVPVVIDGRFNLGLTKVFKKEYDLDAKNMVFRLTVGYKFKL